MPDTTSVHGKFWQRIQGRLVLLILVLLIPTLIIQGYIYYYTLKTRRAVELQTNLEIARVVSKTFEGFINDVLHQELAVGCTLVHPRLSNVEQNHFLEVNKGEYPVLRNLAWADPEGKVLASTNPGMIGASLAKRKYFQQILAGKNWTVSDLLRSMSAQVPIFTINRAIRDEHESLQGVVIATVHADDLDSILAVDRGKGGGVSLVDSKGILVYRYPHLNPTWEQRNWLARLPQIGKALAGKEVAWIGKTAYSDQTRIMANVPVRPVGWSAGAGRTAEDAMAPVRSTLILQAFLFTLITLAGFGAALLLSRPVSRSIRKLRDHAIALGRGEPSTVALGSGTAELKELADSFNVMAEKLRTRESALRETQRHLSSIVDSIADGFFALDRQWRFTHVNDAALGFFGKEQGELIGRSIFYAFPRFGGSVFETSYRRAMDSGQPAYVEAASVVRDRIIEVYAYPGRANLTVLFRDVTDRRRMQEELTGSQERFKLLSETAGRLLASDNPQATVDELCRKVLGHLDCHVFFNFLADPDAGRLHLNACAGIPDEDVRKMEWLDYGVAVCGCAARDAVPIIAEDILNTPDVRTEFMKSHGVQAYACNPLMVHNEVIGTLSFGTRTRTKFSTQDLDLMRMVTTQVASAMERMSLIGKLRRSRDELELRVQERTAELKTANAELARSNQALQDFASIASHDLREPLRKVASFGSILGQKYKESLGSTGGDYLQRMLDATRRMESFLTGLFEYSKVTMNPEPFREVDLYDIVHEVLSDLEVKLAKSGGQVKIDALPCMEADPTQMRQLFQNLIGNALKFHKEGEKPFVHVWSNTDGGKNLRIVVEDKGIGFEEEYVDRIFAPFQRLHGRSSPYEGTGMGLAICRKIVERHGGHIGASSIPGEGASFVVRMPLKQKWREALSTDF